MIKIKPLSVAKILYNDNSVKSAFIVGVIGGNGAIQVAFKLPNYMKIWYPGSRKSSEDISVDNNLTFPKNKEWHIYDANKGYFDHDLSFTSKARTRNGLPANKTDCLLFLPGEY